MCKMFDILTSQSDTAPQPPRGDSKHHESYIVSSHATDINGIARPSQVLRYTQECATLQHEKNPPTVEDLRKDHKAFILSKIFVDMLRPLHSQEHIDTYCWLAPFKGNSLFRYSQLFRGDEEVCRTAALWALVDTQTRRLLRPTDADFGFGFADPLPIEIPRLHFPRELPFETVGERRVCYSDIDVNRHMNNTVYPDMLLDFLPPEVLEGTRVTKMTLSFMAEAPYGETIRILHASNGSLANAAVGGVSATRSDFFRTLREDGRVGVEAEFIFEKLKAD